MKKLDLLRKIIREELRTVLKEELSLLSESKNTSFKEDLKQKVSKSVIPGTLNTTVRRPQANFGNNPLGQLLSETANTMAEDYESISSFTSNDAFDFGASIPTKVSSVQGMLSSARPSSAHEMVQITEVPDFSHFMNKLMNDKI